MVIVYRPYVPRWKRAWDVLKNKPRYWINNYPEIFYSLCITLPVVTVSATYKFYTKGPINNFDSLGWEFPPYYRKNYEVRRPDDELVLNWRVPESYPPDFLIPRAGKVPRRSFRDYAWDVKAEE